MFNKFLLVLSGLLLFGVVAYLGLEASTKPTFVIWFGLSSALLAPAGFTLITLAFKNNNDKLLQQLSKVPEISVLIEKANTQEERIEALEIERASLEDAIKYETLRSVLIEKKNTFEMEAEKLIFNLNDVESKLSKLDIEIENTQNSEVIQNLRVKLRAREQNNIVVNLFDREIIIDVEKIRRIPLVGEFTIAYLRLFQDISSLVDGIFKKNS